MSKKAILFLQLVYKFEVKDMTYYQMFVAEAHCMITKDNYMAVKKKALRVEGDMDTTNGCVTPTDSEFGIPSSSVPPTPPKKIKATPLRSTSGSTKSSVSIEDDLATIFCSQKPVV